VGTVRFLRPLTVTLALLLTACTTPAKPVTAPSPSASAPAPFPTGTPTASRPDHVVLVVFENKAFGTQAGSAKAPYLNQLLGKSAEFTRSSAITHPSQPNYLALFSGSTQGVTSDRCLSRFHDRPNLGAQLIQAGFTFTGYSEGLPQAGYRGCSHDGYAAKHNPWVNFDNVPDSANQPFTAFPADYSQLPTVSFVIPDLCNDMHDCGTATGDAWAARHLEPYRSWAAAHNSLLVITYDEDEGSSGNHILTLITGAGVRPGQYSQPINHYTVLRTMQNLYGLPGIAKSATAAPITSIWD
jgi:phosphatidylinositol-3-phosphatase